MIVLYKNAFDSLQVAQVLGYLLLNSARQNAECFAISSLSLMDPHTHRDHSASEPGSHCCNRTAFCPRKARLELYLENESSPMKSATLRTTAMRASSPAWPTMTMRMTERINNEIGKNIKQTTRMTSTEKKMPRKKSGR